MDLIKYNFDKKKVGRDFKLNSPSFNRKKFEFRTKRLDIKNDKTNKSTKSSRSMKFTTRKQINDYYFGTRGKKNFGDKCKSLRRISNRNIK